MTKAIFDSQVILAALSYAKKGIPVFPCNREKKPITEHGFLDASTDEDQIKGWWSQNPGASIGIPTGEKSGVWVFDVDSYKPGVVDFFNKLIAENGSLPETKTQKTGGGGFQYFFKYPGFKIPSRNGYIASGIDVKGEGGYVILPPSGHLSGGYYEWLDERPAVDASKWLLDLATSDKKRKETPREPVNGSSTAYALKALEGESQRVCQASDGTRNEALNQAAFSMGTLIAGGEISQSLVESALFDAALSAGLSESEIRKTLKSGLTAGERSPRTAPEKNQYNSEYVPKETELPIPLPAELLPVMPFDYALLPETLQPWIKDISERMQCPPDFVAVAVMTAMAAVIGRKVGIRPQEKTDWTVVCNLWGLVVGRPGVLKSPALEAGLAPLKRLIAKANDFFLIAFENHKIDEIAAKIKKEAGEKRAKELLRKNSDADLSAVLAVGEVDVPTLKRYQANDSTPASLGELLRQNPNGLLVFRDELVSLLKGLDREGQEEGRGFYLTAWNGDSPYTFDRIGRGLNLRIPALCLSIIGGTQPGRLSEYIRNAVQGGAADDGLIQRFGLIVWPDVSGPWKNVDRWPDKDAKNRAFEVFDRLDSLDPNSIGAEQDKDIDGNPEGIPFLRFSKEGAELFLEWRTALEGKLREDLHPALESHFAKYRKLIPSISLILHLADGGIGPVSGTTTLKALAWGEYLETHAQRAYSSVSNPSIMVAKEIIKKIKKGKLKTPFGSKDVWRPKWSRLTDQNQVREALQMLEDYNWIYSEKIETKGRPATMYHPNGGWAE